MDKDKDQKDDFLENEDKEFTVKSPFQQSLVRFKKNKLAIFGLVVLLVLIVVVMILPIFIDYDPDVINLASILKQPSLTHLFGTDDIGRDVFTRIIYGGRVSISIGIFSAFTAITVGSIIGAVAGYYGGIIDSILMRFTDLVLTIPVMPLLMILGALFKPNPFFLIIIIGLFNWMSTARLVRGQFLTLRTLDFVTAARALGNSDFRIIFLHIIPNALASIIVSATLTVGRAIILESVLSFLGVGINPPTASWGNMLQGAQSYIVTAPRLAIIPGMFILITVLSINFLGDGLTDATDPRRGI